MTMRSPFVAVLSAIVFGLGGLASTAGASSLTLVPTGPTSLGSVGETTTFDVVMQLDPYFVMGADVGTMLATAQLDAIGAARIISGTNDMAGTNLATANFGLRWLPFNRLGSCAVAGTATICSYAPGASSAGNIGGLNLAPANPGTYTIGRYTLQAFSVGTTTVSFRFRPGVNEWLDGNGDPMPFPTTNTLILASGPDASPPISTPEPSTALLTALGITALVISGRRSRA
jgi:hypothetical protein